MENKKNNQKPNQDKKDYTQKNKPDGCGDACDVKDNK